MRASCLVLCLMAGIALMPASLFSGSVYSDGACSAGATMARRAWSSGVKTSAGSRPR